MADTNALTHESRFGLGRLLGTGLVAAAVAVVANLVVFAVAKSLFDVSFVMPYQGPDSTSEPLPAAYVVVASAIGAVAAAIVLAVLARFVAEPLRSFQIVAAVFTLLSLGGPLSLADTSSGTKAALIVMHLVAATLITSIFTLRSRVRG